MFSNGLSFTLLILQSLLELIPDVQESFQASHDQLPLKSSPDPRRMQESKGDDGDVFPKLKIDSGFAEPAESPKRPENPSLEDTVQPSPTSPSIQVTPVDSLSPCTPSDGSRTPGDNQLYLRSTCLCADILTVHPLCGLLAVTAETQITFAVMHNAVFCLHMCAWCVSLLFLMCVLW